MCQEPRNSDVAEHGWRLLSSAGPQAPPGPCEARPASCAPALGDARAGPAGRGGHGLHPVARSLGRLPRVRGDRRRRASTHWHSLCCSPGARWSSSFDGRRAVLRLPPAGLADTETIVDCLLVWIRLSTVQSGTPPLGVVRFPCPLDTTRALQLARPRLDDSVPEASSDVEEAPSGAAAAASGDGLGERMAVMERQGIQVTREVRGQSDAIARIEEALVRLTAVRSLPSEIGRGGARASRRLGILVCRRGPPAHLAGRWRDLSRAPPSLPG